MVIPTIANISEVLCNVSFKSNKMELAEMFSYEREGYLVFTLSH